MQQNSNSSTDLQTPSFVDEDIFGQLLEIEEDDPGFIKGLVETYLSQAEGTLLNLMDAL
jgi:hypothetical protein